MRTFMPAGWIRSIFMAITLPRSRCSLAPRMRLRSRLLQSGKAAHARHPEGKSANAIKVCAMNAKHPPGPPMTLGNMRAVDGRLRFELQSAATAPKSAQHAAAPQEIERLRGELDALKNDVKELTETQHQAAHTIAAMKD